MPSSSALRQPRKNRTNEGNDVIPDAFYDAGALVGDGRLRRLAVRLGEGWLTQRPIEEAVGAKETIDPDVLKKEFRQLYDDASANLEVL